MQKKIAVLSMIGAVLLSGPLCRCGMEHPLAVTRSPSCGHCPTKSEDRVAGGSASKSHPRPSRSSSFPEHGCKDCGCPHGTQAIPASTPTLDPDEGPARDLWAAPSTEVADSAREGHAVPALTVRGPPHPEAVPLFILHLHLAI